MIEKFIRYSMVFCITVLIVGCSTGLQKTAYQLHGERGVLRPGSVYTVKRGDTLFGIAWRYGIDLDELARWNGIFDKNHILVGQTLRTIPPNGVQRQKISTPTITNLGQPGWSWPLRGNVVQNFSATAPGQQGLRISGKRGQAVNAASDGEVAYTGKGLSGFGWMIIIRHSNKVLSAYGFLDEVLVREKQKVRRGQIIGRVGVGPKNSALLHFETRKQGQPVDPYSYIGTTPH